MTRRVLITGGSGFIGTNLIEHYLADSATVLNLDPKQPRNPAQAHVWQRCDPLDADAVVAAVTAFGPTHVLHMGARTDLRGATVDEYALNTRGVELVVDAIRQTPSVERAIFASSRMVCRIGYQPTSDDDYCPNTVYGESKVVGERIVRKANLEATWTIVRPSSIWGPWFEVPYRDFFLAVARGRYVHVKGARILKSFGYVENSVYELEKLLAAPVDRVSGKTLYLADYPPIEVGHWAELIRSELGEGPIRTAPLAALKVAARSGDLLERFTSRSAPLTTFRLTNLLTQMEYDLSELEALVGDLPVPLDTAVERTVDWLRSEHLV
jgi:nucleoside-diphosphate-sugar epimerase